MAERFSSSTVSLVRRNGCILTLMLLIAPGGLLLFGFEPEALVTLVLSVGLSGLVLAANPLPSDEKATVEADAEGVRVNGQLVAPQARIRNGFVVPNAPGKHKVRIERRMALPLELRVSDENEGRAMLRALGLDATQRAMTFMLPSRAISDWKFSIPSSIAAFVIFSQFNAQLDKLGRMTPVTMLSMMALLSVLVVGFLFLTRTKLTVGADGLWVSQLGQRRFYRYDEIAGVDTWKRGLSKNRKWEGIALRLRSGEQVKIGVQTNGDGPEHGERIHVITERVRAAMESHRRGDPAADAALLGRGERDMDDWIRSLRAMGSGAAADHRTAPLDPERLWRIVEDPRATPDARVGAAVALGGSVDENVRTRLKTAAAAVAAPKLRIALEAAASEDEEALREALASVEEPKPRARA
ncbi:hypothetical protein [Polyangium aurulentum]|uniref:hypothetical protein n=1 Tax=Polyangium aurulentum TaxID=2567896 RepID=UPI0010AEE121|nr:hypothetical protein [Polyangium aurulentum]UQA61639.1 hypothetical protein E8A73_014670 [Polyangium aurulentum]